MATHSSILAWAVPRTEEPGGLGSMRGGEGCHRGSDTITITTKLRELRCGEFVTYI